MESSDKDPRQKKIPEVQTFPVPFALGEKKENITITTSTLSKTSKEQIINQAFKFHSEGNIQEAAKYYQYFIDQGFSDPRVLSNYGMKDIYALDDFKRVVDWENNSFYQATNQSSSVIS